MIEVSVKGKSLPEAYHNALIQLQSIGQLTDCRDYNTNQIECSMTVVVEEPTSEPRISRLIIGGEYDLQRYEMEMLDGILDEMIGHGWTYTYHSRFAPQIPFIIRELKRNPSSRRAVISIRDFETDSNCSDPPCLSLIQYFIRNNKLDCCANFRSNDLVEAYFFNSFALVRLQEKIANELGIEIGTYSHRSSSMHCYQKDFDKLNGFVNAINTRDFSDLTYEYEGFYKDMMEEQIPKIMKMVDEQKRKYGIKT